jgi:adenylyl cyclase-associated protein
VESCRRGGEKAEADVALEKPPRLECEDDKRWFIEHQTKAQGVVTLKDATHKQEVVISNCVNATIVVDCKVKSLMIDNCKKTQVVFKGAISSCEVVNCSRVKVQCKERIPCISIDKTDGITVYVSWEGRDIQVLSSKSSEMNISFPKGPEEEAEWVEFPIPEQFETRIHADGSLATKVSELYSA